MHSTSSSLQLVHGAPCSTTLQRTFLARQHWQAFEARRLTALKLGLPLLLVFDEGALLFWPATCGATAAVVAVAGGVAAAAVLLLAGAAVVSVEAIARDVDCYCLGSSSSSSFFFSSSSSSNLGCAKSRQLTKLRSRMECIKAKRKSGVEGEDVVVGLWGTK